MCGCINVRFACLVLLSARAVPGKFDAKGFGSAADLGVRLCHSSLVVAVDGLVLEDFVSADVHCGVLVLVYWSVAVGAWLACLIHHDFVGCGIFDHDRWWWLARSRAMLLDCEMLGLWLGPQFLSVVLPNMFSVSCACCDAGLRRCVVDISRSWVLPHNGMESYLLHIDNFDVGFSGISPVFFVCGPGMKKSVKDVCQRIDVFAFSAPSQVGIAAASAAAYRLYFMFSTFCQDASRAAASWRAGAFVYIFCVEGVFVLGCAFGQIVSLVAAAASGNVFSQVASLAAAAWCAGAFVYIFCVEGVFVLGCVFLELFLAPCAWFLAFGVHVLGLRIENLCCVSLTQHSRLGGVACPLIGAEQKEVEWQLKLCVQLVGCRVSQGG